MTTTDDTTTEPAAREGVMVRKPARKSPSRASRAASKLAAPAAKTTAKPKTTVAAKPVAAKAAKAETPKLRTQRDSQKIVAEALIAAGADLAAKWNAKSHQDVGADFAAECIGRWLSYLPNCEWDARLPERSTAGRRPKSA